MVGVTERGPHDPLLITSVSEFMQQFGPILPEPASALRDKWALDPNGGGQWWQFPLAVKGFFDNGGQRLFVKRIAKDDLNALSVDDFIDGLQTLKKVGDIALCLAPGLWSAKIQNALIELCEMRTDCFAILDAPNGLDIAGVSQISPAVRHRLRRALLPVARSD